MILNLIYYRLTGGAKFHSTGAIHVFCAFFVREESMYADALHDQIKFKCLPPQDEDSDVLIQKNAASEEENTHVNMSAMGKVDAIVADGTGGNLCKLVLEPHV